jgi:alanyl-tRNA synthetase
VKLLAQRLTRENQSVVALLGTTVPSPAVIFARSSNLNFDLGGLLRALVTAAGGRGGGGKDFAQGGIPDATKLQPLLDEAAARLKS